MKQPGLVKHVVLVIRSLETRAVIERWPFFFYYNQNSREEGSPNKERALQSLIYVLKQIMTKSTLLPELETQSCMNERN
jgi:hypothetical protein